MSQATHGSVRRPHTVVLCWLLFAVCVVWATFLFWLTVLAVDEQGNRAPRSDVAYLVVVLVTTATGGWRLLRATREGRVDRLGVALLLLGLAVTIVPGLAT